ncbi:hypothetical protein GJV06_20775 [Enterobacteriaceae bacterium RIT691]|nr:hypothetical protein [Enterobacteriaceae bacterium RIT691]
MCCILDVLLMRFRIQGGNNLPQSAVTAALTALAGGGNMVAALAGASAPELAHLLKEPTSDDPAVNAIAHAILGGAIAALQGKSAAAGAVGAATGELMARAIAEIYYPGVKLSDLSEDQKQTISSLASVSAGIAGGLAGGNTAGAVTGAAAGKNAVENNSLSFGMGMDNIIAVNAAWNQYAVDNNLTPEETQAGLNRIANGDLPAGQAPATG